VTAFRCWFCNRYYRVDDARRGERFTCSCHHRVKVPRQSGRSSRARTATDWLVEVAVYGGCGAALGFGLGVLILSRVPVLRRGEELVLGLTALGLLAGAIFGEAGLNWIGRRIRAREEA
jgi:hypothetical protein